MVASATPMLTVRRSGPPATSREFSRTSSQSRSAKAPAASFPVSGKEDRKFFAANPPGDIGIALGRCNHARICFKRLIACFVSERIVHVLEEINVNHQERQWPNVALRARELGAKSCLELLDCTIPSTRRAQQAS